MFALAAFVACDPAEPTSYRPLDPAAHAIRASMALRGVRPTEAELARVRADPRALDALIDEWLDTPEFGETVADMYAEWLEIRADVIDPLPALGPLDDRQLNEMYTSLVEQPLNLVRHVVTEDRPLTDLVTADYTVADEVAAIAFGLPWDPAGPTLQATRWQDARPAAGLLAEGELWRRHESAGSNFHRLRADKVADVFLCSSFATRDIVVEGGITISDEFEVADAVTTQDECVNCHQALDPLAAFFWGFKKQIKQTTVTKGYNANCSTVPTDDTFKPYSPSEYCYPLEPWSTEDEDWWVYWELRPPGYYGAPGDDLADLGRFVAADPRFAQCSARRFYAYLTQSEPADVPLAFAEELQHVLVDGDFSAKALARAIVRSDPFAAVTATPDAPVAAAGVQIVRPEQYARTIEALTGFAWVVDPDIATSCQPAGDDGTECWGPVDLMRSARFGYRAMAGGIDAYALTRPTHAPTPPRELVWERFAGEAAGYVARTDLAEPDRSRRRLLREVDEGDVRDRAVRRQIVALVPRVLGQIWEDDDPRVDELLAVWRDKRDRATVADAWALVLTALFVDPDLVFY